MARNKGKMRIVEDPSIAWCAQMECDRLWRRIEKMTAEGEWYFRAREIVLAEEVPRMSKLYGKTVADRVSFVIQCRAFKDLSKETMRRLDERAPKYPKPESTGAGWFGLVGLVGLAILIIALR